MGKLWCNIISFALIVICLTTSSIPATTSSISAITNNASPRNIPIATEFYIWYGASYSGKCNGGLGSSHWNDTPDRIIIKKPLIGYYCSADKSTIKLQLNEIKSTGISVLMVSWWNDAATNRALNNLLSIINSTSEYSSWFKVAILVETRLWMAPYDLIWSTFYAPYIDIMSTWDNKPLLIFFNQPHQATDARFTMRTLGVDYLPDWDFWHGTILTDAAPNFIPYQYYGKPTISADGVVTATPRFDDYYLHLSGSRPQYQRYDPNLTEGMYEQEWNYILENKANVSMVIVNSWNEWHELNAIEPSVQDGDILMSTTYLYIQQLSSEIEP